MRDALTQTTMNKTKDHQAQEYAEKRLQGRYPAHIIATTHTFKKSPMFDTYDIQQAFEDGYTACEQSKEDSKATLIQGWVAKLREVLEKLVTDGDIEPIHVSVDEIINRVTEDI